MAARDETVDQDFVDDSGLDDKKSVEKEATRKYVSTFGFDEKTKKTDMAFIVEQECLYVSSAIIELSSTVLGELIEKSDRNKSGLIEIEIRDCKCKDFVDFLCCFYPGKSHQLSDDSVFHMLQLARQYNIHLHSCEVYLLKCVTSTETTQEMFSKCMSAAYEFNIQSVKDASLERMVRKQKEDLTVLIKPLPINDAARASIYDSVLPAMISNENKLAFLLASIPPKADLNISCFANAQYQSMQAQCTYHPSKITILHSNRKTFKLWGLCFKVNIDHQNVKDGFFLKLNLVQVHSNIDGQNDGQTVCEGGTNASYVSRSIDIAVMYILHNRIVKKDGNDKLEFKRLKTLAAINNATHVSIPLNTNGESAFMVDSDFKISVHVLMDEPCRIDNDE